MKKIRSPRILFFVTEDWYFWSHRLELARAAKQEGYEVAVITRVQQHGQKITAEGFKLIPINLVRHGSNPWQELKLIWALVRIYRAERPDIVHHVAIKPVLDGSLAARIARVPAMVNALAGLGYVFTSKQWKAKLLRPVVQLAFRLLLNRSNNRIIVQNPDDQRLLVNSGILNPGYTVLVRGSGVDTKAFLPTPEAQGIPVVILASRMLWDKGVREFVDTARHLLDAGVTARFALVGDSDPGNQAAVPEAQLKAWRDEGAVEWWGLREDMPKVFAQSHVVCLPSTYGEGVPKVLIEAAASGRPIVATDAPGCREIVRNEENGLLVPVRDVPALVKALRRLIEDASLRQRMGKRGREIAEAEFKIEDVVAKTLAIYRDLLDSAKSDKRVLDSRA